GSERAPNVNYSRNFATADLSASATVKSHALNFPIDFDSAPNIDILDICIPFDFEGSSDIDLGRAYSASNVQHSSNLEVVSCRRLSNKLARIAFYRASVQR